jgi:acyl carrier protein
MPGTQLDAQIRQFILKQFPLSRKRELKNSDALLESGIVDSQGVLEIVGFLEQQFSVSVADDELIPENFESVSSIVTFVATKAAARGKSRA